MLKWIWKLEREILMHRISLVGCASLQQKSQRPLTGYTLAQKFNRIFSFSFLPFSLGRVSRLPLPLDPSSTLKEAIYSSSFKRKEGKRKFDFGGKCFSLFFLF